MRARLLFPAVLALAFATPLVAAEIHDAVTQQNVAAVERMLARDPSLAVAPDGMNNTPMHLAAQIGSVEILRLLLDAGAPVDVGDADNSTALDVAAQSGQLDAVKLLVESGADARHSDNNGMTPLHFASYEGHDDVALYLLEHGADPAAVTSRGSVALHGAALRGSTPTVAVLLEHGVPANARNEGGFTPLLSGTAGQADVELVRLLVEHGAWVDDRDREGTTALHNAAWRGNLDVVRYLIEQGASVNALMNGGGNTPLHNAASTGNIEVVRALLDAGTQVDCRTTWGATPLQWAARQGGEDVVQLLLERGADARAVSNDGATPFFAAVDNGRLPAARLLAEAGADVDVRSPDVHRTPLHLVALRGQVDAATLLLDRGAEIDAVDDYGMTPVQCAARYGNPEIVELLRARGANASGLEVSSGRPALLDRKLGSGEAALWYLGNCGWAVKTKKHVLIFDYWEQNPGCAHPGLLNGHISPDELRNEDVIVFATHQHADHWDRVIDEWAGAIPKITYVFGFRPEDLPESRQAGYSGPDYVYIGPRQEATVRGMDVRTIAANDAGVGFLVTVDGVTVFHAGDHAGWADGERDGYFAEIDYLDGLVDSPDVAFVNVTGCHAHDPARLREGTVYTLDTLKPRVAVPTHAGNMEYTYRTVAEELAAEGVTTPIVYPTNPGDSFIYANGTMTMTR
jgi:ankyrin repeat protein/L-ascorbate metabolism protein UlaG (beta-lactamase superfamily)